jgi:O-antigen ligase
LYLTLIYLGLHLTTAWVSGGTYAGRQGTLNTLYLAVGLGFAFLAGSAQQAIGLLAMMTVTQSVLTLWLALHSENGIWSGTVYRAGGTFGHPTTLYIVLAPCLPLIAALPAERPAAARVARGLATLLMLTALLLTWYRAALVAAAVVQVFLTARLSRDHTGRMRRIAVIGTGMALLVLLAGYVRMTGEANSISSGYSIDGRQRLWRAGWQTFCEHPLTGVGLNHLAIPLTMERYGRTEYCVARQPMNVPLLLVAELGIGGGLLFTLTVITIARTLPGRDRVSLGVQGAWLTFAIMGLFDAPFGTEGREAGTVLLGALLGITLLCRPPFPLQTASCETGEPEVLR